MSSLLPTIEASGLRKSFAGRDAVAGISFAVHRGQCFGFLGPNGAGKTSTMRMIGCTSPISGGSLTILGHDARAEPRAIKRRLGIVPQDDNLDQTLTCRENLSLYGRYFDLDRASLAARAIKNLEFVQLQERADADVRGLSGGMRRRLLIARALMNEPDILILDEPTTGLDPQARHLLWQRLRLLQQANRTLILCTHYMDEAEQLCDQLVIMHAGKIIASGSPQELIAKHASREVVEVFAPEPLRRTLWEKFSHQVAAWEQLADCLLFFVDRGDQLVNAIAPLCGDAARIALRRSSLEDVYLKLTGRRLQEDPADG